MRYVVLAVAMVAAVAGAEAAPNKAGGANRKAAGANNASQQQAMAQRIASTPAMLKLQAARTLILTPSQQAHLNNLESQAKQELLALRDQLKTEKKSGAGKPDSSDRRQAAQQLRPQMQAIGQKLSAGIDAALTADQKAQLAQLPGGGNAGKGAKGTKGNKAPAAASVQSNRLPAPAAVAAPVVASASSVTPTTTSTLGLVNPFTP